jgi:hypothetical protein
LCPRRVYSTALRQRNMPLFWQISTRWGASPMKTVCMRRRFARILVALIVAGLLAAGWYAYDKGFTKKWRATVTSELRKRGFEVSLRRMTLEPWRGLVAKEVKLYDARDRKRILGVVDEVRLVINFADFFQGKPFLEALDLRDAHLALPLDPKKSPRRRSRNQQAERSPASSSAAALSESFGSRRLRHPCDSKREIDSAGSAQDARQQRRRHASGDR